WSSDVCSSDLQSYITKFTNRNIAIIDNEIKLPKLGLVKFAKSREVKGHIMNATVRRNPSGKYFISILVETEIEDLPKTNQSTGIDIGITDFATLSDGTTFANPRFLRTLENKLEREQRKLSRRYEQAKKDKKPLHEAKNFQKQRVKVALI